MDADKNSDYPVNLAAILDNFEAISKNAKNAARTALESDLSIEQFSIVNLNITAQLADNMFAFTRWAMAKAEAGAPLISDHAERLLRSLKDKD
ncbi:MAG: hypothetical protein AB7O04_13745 [Hyphomonadaceae bacterium]